MILQMFRATITAGIFSMGFSGGLMAQGAGAFGFKATKIGGKEIDLSKEYAGKVLLIANTASKCGYTPQLGGLQTQHEAFSAKGLVVLAFPSNDFKQELSDEGAIAELCDLKYKAKYAVFRPIHVNGPEAHPLFKYLTDNAADKGDVKWNFEKFLVGKDGKVVARFRSNVKPTDSEVTKAIELALK